MSKLMIVEVPSHTSEFRGVREVAELIRCKECKHCSLDFCVKRTVSGKERCINICNRHSTEWVVDKDWFCADGERKE